MSYQCRVLVLLAHPVLEKSRVNARLAEAAAKVEGVTVEDLYERYPNFYIDKDAEQQRLLDYDVIVFQHPMFWYSAPALLKEWQDIVLEYGFAYGRDGTALVGKALMNAFTAGSYRHEFEDQVDPLTLRQLMLPFERTARYCGMHYLPPFTCYGAGTLSEPDIESSCQRYATLLRALAKGRDGVVELAGKKILPAAMGGQNHG